MKKKLRDECVFTKVTPTRTEGKWQVGKQKSPEQGCPRFVGTGATFQTTRTKWSILRTNRWWFGLDDSSCPVFLLWPNQKPNKEKRLMAGFISLYVCVCTLARLGHSHSVVCVPIFYKHTDQMLSWSVTVYSATVTQHPPLQRLTILL